MIPTLPRQPATPRKPYLLPTPSLPARAAPHSRPATPPQRSRLGGSSPPRQPPHTAPRVRVPPYPCAKGSHYVRTLVRTLRATRIVRTLRGHLKHVGILVRTLRGTRRDALRGTRTLRGLVSSRTSPPQWPLSAFGRLRTSSTSAISSACESSGRSPLLLMIRQSRLCVSSPLTPLTPT